MGIEILFLKMGQQCHLVVSGPLSGIECIVVLHISIGVTLCMCVCVFMLVFSFCTPTGETAVIPVFFWGGGGGGGVGLFEIVEMN